MNQSPGQDKNQSKIRANRSIKLEKLERQKDLQSEVSYSRVPLSQRGEELDRHGQKPSLQTIQQFNIHEQQTPINYSKDLIQPNEMQRYFKNDNTKESGTDLKNNEESQNGEKKINFFTTIFLQQKIIKFIKLRWHNQLQQKHYYMLNDRASHYQKQTQQKDNYFPPQNNDEVEITCAEQYIPQKFILFLEMLDQLIPIFDPIHPSKLFWDTVYVLTLIILFFLIPLKVSFQISWEQVATNELPFICLMILVIDTGISMNSGFFSAGEIIKDRKVILSNYMRNIFVSDAISIIILAISLLGFGYEADILLILFYFKLQHLFKIMNKLEETLNLKQRQKLIMNLSKVLFNVLFIAHLFACIWIFEHSFTSSQENSWMQFKGLEDSNWEIKYLYAMYFSVVTMVTVGFGDITPKSDREVLLCIGTILTSCGVFAYSINEIGVIFQDHYKLQKAIAKNFEIINDYMEQKQISSRMRFQVRQYLNYFWIENKSNIQQEQLKIINQLPESLRTNLVAEANKIIMNYPIFKNNFSFQFLAKVATIMQEAYCQPNDVIYQQDTSGSSANLYFVEKGLFDEIYQEKTKAYREFTIGNSFGVFSFFTGLNRRETVVARQFGSLLLIKREKFITLLHQFPDDAENFYFLKDQIMNNGIYKLEGQKCESCDSDEHDFIICPLLHYVPNQMNLWKRNNNLHNKFREEEFKRGGKFRQKKKNTYRLLDSVSLSAEMILQNYGETLGELLPEIATANHSNISIMNQEDEDDSSFDDQTIIKDDHLSFTNKGTLKRQGSQNLEQLINSQLQSPKIKQKSLHKGEENESMENSQIRRYIQDEYLQTYHGIIGLPSNPFTENNPSNQKQIDLIQIKEEQDGVFLNNVTMDNYKEPELVLMDVPTFTQIPSVRERKNSNQVPKKQFQPNFDKFKRINKFQNQGQIQEEEKSSFFDEKSFMDENKANISIEYSIKKQSKQIQQKSSQQHDYQGHTDILEEKDKSNSNLPGLSDLNSQQFFRSNSNENQQIVRTLQRSNSTASIFHNKNNNSAQINNHNINNHNNSNHNNNNHNNNNHSNISNNINSNDWQGFNNKKFTAFSRFQDQKPTALTATFIDVAAENLESLQKQNQETNNINYDPPTHRDTSQISQNTNNNQEIKFKKQNTLFTLPNNDPQAQKGNLQTSNHMLTSQNNNNNNNNFNHPEQEAEQQHREYSTINGFEQMKIFQFYYPAFNYLEVLKQLGQKVNEKKKVILVSQPTQRDQNRRATMVSTGQTKKKNWERVKSLSKFGRIKKVQVTPLDGIDTLQSPDIFKSQN